MAKTTTPATEPQVQESPMDYAEHRKSYSLFVNLLKWSAIVTGALLVILYFLVQPMVR